MRKIVDSNFLQHEELRTYLADSAENYAVLTDDAAMEAYKGDTLASIYQSMEILSQRPKQIHVLKGTQIVCGLRARGSRIQRKMIDEDQTRGFAQYCRHLDAARRGDVSLQHQLLDHGREATAHMTRMLTDARGMPSVFDDLAKSFTNGELHILRTGAPYNDSLIRKCIQHIMMFAAFMFRDHPTVTRLPNAEELPDRFIFRVALCAYLLALRWISVGGAKNVKPERMRNDLVDVNFAAFATYFDGLLTLDDKLFRVYREACFWLEAVFSTKPSGNSPCDLSGSASAA
jgi:hypothetical protein